MGVMVIDIEDLVTCPETKEEECHEEVVITIFVQYRGWRGVGPYNFENSISTEGRPLITVPRGNGTGKIADLVQL